MRFDVASGGWLDPAWRTVLLKHPDRFVVGTDTWTASRWDELVGGMQSIRSWLSQLSPEITEQIVYRNAERLFGNP